MSHTPETATTIRATGVLKIPDIAKKIYLHIRGGNRLHTAQLTAKRVRLFTEYSS